MTAGLNMRFSLWRMNEQEDDYVGGSSISGTVVYQNVLGMMQGFPPEQLLEQQGLETIRTFNFVINPGGLDIRERDELEVTAPFDHFYFGDRFRITSILVSSFSARDPRSYMMLRANRSERAHSQQ